MTTWKDILVECASYDSPFTVVGIVHALGLNKGHVASVLLRLRGFSYVRYADTKKAGFGGYEVTAQGRSVAGKIKRGEWPDKKRE